MIEQVNINEVTINPNNPRLIKDDKFEKLVKSIQEFPEMLKLRPIVVDDNMVVLGGNMRLQAWRNVHGVTPIIPTFEGGYRNSLVFYPLNAIVGLK